MILVISSSQKFSSLIADNFIKLGYLARGTTFLKAKSDFSMLYRAVLIDDINSETKKEKIDSVYDLPNKIQIYFISKLTKDTDTKKPSPIFATKIAKRMNDIISGEKTFIGKYKCAGLDCSAKLKYAYYFDKKLDLTKTEKRILGFLCYSYSTPQTAKSIIKHAFSSSAVKESTVRGNISLINKKLFSLCGRKFIEFYKEKGYIISTPELKNDFLR